MSNTNNNKDKGNTPEPTLGELYNLMKHAATKEDIIDIKQQIVTYTNDTNAKLSTMDNKVEQVISKNAINTGKIEYLVDQLELLKQDRLKNNICISGVPTDIISANNTSDPVIAIAKKLGVDINNSHFSSHAVANNKFIIVSFYNLRHKQSIINKIRVKRSLMVEEVFKHDSNSQIYLNDHLTPFYNKLYLIARNAKKDGKLVSAMSYGGKIRVRKNINDAPILITNESQLMNIIDMEPIISNSDDSFQSTNDEHSFNNSSKTNKQPGPKSKTTKTDKSRSNISNNNSNNNKSNNLKRKFKNTEGDFPAKRIK